jgi:hypothetical protein
MDPGLDTVSDTSVISSSQLRLAAAKAHADSHRYSTAAPLAPDPVAL